MSPNLNTIPVQQKLEYQIQKSMVIWPVYVLGDLPPGLKWKSNPGEAAKTT